VHDEVREWQARPLDDVYANIYVDAVRAKIRDVIDRDVPVGSGHGGRCGDGGGRAHGVDQAMARHNGMETKSFA